MALAEVWETSPRLPRLPLVENMRAAAQVSGKAPSAQVRDIARLAFGRGRLHPEEYFYFRLFDKRYTDQLQQAFVGKRLESQLHQVTCAPDWGIVAHDKLLCYALLASFGFPVPRTVALYRHGANLPGMISLSTPSELTAALRGSLKWPLFGKPVRGMRSVGVISIESYDAGSDILRLTQGRTVGVDELAHALADYARDGYLFQEPILQHPEIAAICGKTVGTVRVVILLGAEGPELYKALWKVPVGANVADNFWREGNILAALDPDTGRIMRAVQGVGPALREVDAHPTSGQRLVGHVLPNWNELRELAMSAAGVMPGVRMQAWDIALGVEGPILVEVNIGGDYNLPQLATGEGMLDERFLAFIRDCAAKRGLERLVKRL